MRETDSLNKIIWIRVLKLILAAGILVVGIVRLGVLFRPVDTDVCINKIESFLEQKSDSYEVIGYGSSIMWRGFDPMVLEDEFGISAYNLGTNWESINTTKFFLQESLKTQSPKVVLIEMCHANWVKENEKLDGEAYYSRAFGYSCERSRYLKNYLGSFGELIAYYFPLYGFHSNYSKLTKLSFEKVGNINTDFYKGKDYQQDFFSTTNGFAVTNEVSRKTEKDLLQKDLQEPLSESAIRELDEIVEICEASGATPVFYLAPHEEYDVCAEAVEQYSADHGIYFINMWDELETVSIDPEKDFADMHHMNASGAAKVAHYLGNYICEHDLLQTEKTK